MSLATELIEGAPGAISDYAGINLPAGYLWANGQAVSRSTYVRLFSALTVSVTGTTTSGSNSVSAVSQDLTALPVSVVGMPVSGPGIPASTTISGVTSTTLTLSNNATASASGVAIVVAPHGVGDGSTTFNVPDARGRVSAGRDDMGGVAAGRLSASGVGTSGLDGTKLGAAGGTDRHQLTAAQMPSHTHQYNSYNASAAASSGSTVTVANSSTSPNTTSAGSDQAHPNVQPTLVLNKIIKT